MKRVIAIIAAILLFTSVACAEGNWLSDLSFDDLCAYQRAITQEIMTRPEWKETKVPSGSWLVGVDIPAGLYSINPGEIGAYLRVYDDNGSLISSGGIRNEDDMIGRIMLKNDYLVEISDGALFFAPSIGLGF